MRFTHPLLGSAVVARQTPARRRSLHARLADVVPSAEERARHLALATAEPSREIASILEDAARSAHARGAPATAAELAEQALRLTPPASRDDARRRLLVGRRHALPRRGRRPSDGAARASASGSCAGQRAGDDPAHLAGVQASPQDAVALYREALAEAEGDDALEATIHLRLAALMRFSEGIERGHGARRARRPRRLAGRRCRPALPRARGLRSHALQHRTRHPDRGDGGGALARAITGRLAARRWPDMGLRHGSCAGRRTSTARGASSRVLPCRQGAERPRGRSGGALDLACSSGGPGTGTRPSGTRPTRWTSGRSSAA